MSEIRSVGADRLYPRWSSPRFWPLVQLRKALEAAVALHLGDRRAAGAGLVLIDLGCGAMPYRPIYEPFVDQYLGADLPGNPEATLAIDARTGKVDLPDSSADVIVSTQVLEHVEDPVAYLREARRMAKPDALMFLSTHGYWHYHPDPTDYWRWTGAGLRKIIAEHGWQVVHVVGVIGFAAAAGCLFQDALAFRIPRRLRPLFTIPMQAVIRILDSFYSASRREENAAIYLVVARRVESPEP